MRHALWSVSLAVLIASAVAAQGPVDGPPSGPPLWPPEAIVEQQVRILGPELESLTEKAPELAGVREILIAEYRLPGPPVKPDRILSFYRRALQEPGWHAFYTNVRPGSDTASVAYRGDAGFISVLARARGATVTFVAGDIELQSIKKLEKVTRQAVASGPMLPSEVRQSIIDALKLSGEGKTQRALVQLQRIVADYPRSDTAQFGIAQVLAKSGKVPEAKRAFRTAIEIAPMNVPCRVGYGKLLLQTGDLESARYELLQAWAMDRWSSEINSLVGSLYEKQGDSAQAEQYYRRAVYIAGSSPADYVNLGRMLEKRGKKDDARSAYEDALKLKSDFAPALEALKRLR